MAVELATAYVSLTASAKGIAKSLNDELGDPVDKASNDAGDRSAKGFLGKFKLGLGGLAAIATGALGAVAVGGILKDSIGAASDLNESVSKVNVVFGDSAASVSQFADNAARGLGQSKQQALEALGTYGNLFKSMGIGTDVAASLSQTLVQNAADLASFNNASPEDALLALRSGLTGETEPLKRFGINLNDARLKAEALRLGLVTAAVDQKKLSTAQETADKATRKVADSLKKYGADSTQYTDAVRDQEQANNALADVLEGKVPATLTAAQKAQAAYSLIQQDSALAAGDFARTSDGLANKQRIVAAEFTDLKAKIGTAFLPAVLAVANFVSDRVIPAFSGLADQLQPLIDRYGPKFVAVFETIAGTISKVDIGAIFDGASSAISPVVGFLSAVADSVRSIAEKLFAIDWQAVFGRALEIIAPVADGLLKVGAAVLDAAQQALPPLTKAFEYLAFTILPPVIDKAAVLAGIVADVLGVALRLLAPVIQFLGDNMNVLVPALIAATGAFIAFKAASAVVSTVSNVTSAISTLKGVADTFGVSFGRATLEATKQTGPISKLGEAFDGVKGKLSGFVSSVKSVGSSLASGFNSVKTALSNAASAVAGYVKQLALYVKQGVIAAATAVRTAAAWVAEKVALVASAVAAKATAAAQWLLNAAMSANPIGLVVAALAALAAGLIYAYTHSETFRNIVDAIGRVILGVFKTAISFITDTAVPAVVGFATAVGEKLGAVVQFFIDLPGNIISAIGGLATLLFDKGKDLLTGLVEGYLSVWLAVGKFFLGLGQDVVDFIGDTARTLYDKGKSLLQGLFDGVLAIDLAIANFFLGLPGKIAGFFVSAGSWLLDAGKSIGRGLLDGIANALSAGYDFATGIIGDIASGLKSVINGILGQVESFINVGLDAADTAAGPFINFSRISIPRLADGGVITSPTLAMVGEVGRARPEIVTPERLMRDVFRSELASRPPLNIEQHFHDTSVDAREASAELAWALRLAGV